MGYSGIFQARLEVKRHLVVGVDLPKVSVIIPAYNCASYLPAAIESVLAQTYTDTEILLVDDGSTDDTRNIVAPYLDRVQYIRQSNKGLPGARNTGIRASSGEYIALLDGDDSWLPTKLEQQMPRFSDLEVGIVYSDFAVRYSNGRSQPSYLADRPLATEGYALDNYIRSRFLFPSTMVLRRSCMEECGLFDEEMLVCEDVELFARICMRWKVALVRESLMVRNEGTHNITANLNKLSQYTILALTKVLAKEPHLPASSRRIIHTELGRQHWWRGYAAFQSGDMAAARIGLRNAIKYDGSNNRKSMLLLALSYLPQSIIRGLGTLRR